MITYKFNNPTFHKINNNIITITLKVSNLINGG